MANGNNYYLQPLGSIYHPDLEISCTSSKCCCWSGFILNIWCGLCMGFSRPLDLRTKTTLMKCVKVNHNVLGYCFFTMKSC